MFFISADVIGSHYGPGCSGFAVVPETHSIRTPTCGYEYDRLWATLPVDSVRLYRVYIRRYVIICRPIQRSCLRQRFGRTTGYSTYSTYKSAYLLRKCPVAVTANNKGKYLEKKNRTENGVTLEYLFTATTTRGTRSHLLDYTLFSFLISLSRTYLRRTYRPTCLPMLTCRKKKGKKTVSARSRAKPYNGFFLFIWECIRKNNKRTSIQCEIRKSRTSM